MTEDIELLKLGKLNLQKNIDNIEKYSHKRNRMDISASFLIISKIVFMFSSWKTSSSYLDMRFMLGGTYVLETFPDNSINFLNIVFGARLKGRPSEIIGHAMEIVRRVSSEVINFWEFPSIPKTSEPFEKLLELLSVVIFDAEVKPEISDELVSLDEVILLELRRMVDLMAANDLFCRLVMDALIFSE